MATRLLVIHRQLVFAVTIKQALEQTGGFAVHPFTKAEAAFDFLRDHPQDIALVDFNLPGRSGGKIIQQLRLLQPDIALIVTPQLSASDQRSYGVQGSLNSPFSARDLLPLLQNALDEAPNESLKDSTPPIMGGQMTTSNLGDQKRIKRQQMGTTQNLGGESADIPPEPAQTNLLNTDENKPQTRQLGDLNYLSSSRPFVNDNEQPSNRPTTRPFIDDPAPPPTNKKPVDPFKTRNFEDEVGLNDLRPPKTEPLTPKAPPPTVPEVDQFQTRNLHNDVVQEEPNFGTRILPDIPSESVPDGLQTRQLPGNEPQAYDDPIQTRDLGRQDPFGTRPLDTGGTTPLPPRPPEFSSLDRVLQSFALDEPLADEMDTPAVPTKDSDALRQFMATSSSFEDAGSFDDVLGAIEPDTIEKPKQQRQVDFEGLVKSMQRNEPQSRLPDRQQQLMDFVLTSGMDSVLEEIEKTKTGKLPKASEQPPVETPPIPRPTKVPPPAAQNTNFQKLAQEEPPLPTLEENGTVSDLLVGIADSNFRDVLALLNDSSTDSSNPTPPRVVKAQTPPQLPAVQTDSQYLDDFLQSTEIDSESVQATPPRLPADRTYDFNFDYDDEDDGATVAGVVLQSTTDITSTPGEFSLDQLMSDINDRLTTHKLKVRPLPSWDMDTTAFHAPITDTPSLPSTAKMSPSKKMPGEPSFLPEMFPEEAFVAPALPELEVEELEIPEVWTTQASEPSLETIEEVDANAETMVEAGYFDELVTDEPDQTLDIPATIDADMFSGILEDEASFDDAPRYDSEAESSNQQPVYWDEALVETEADVTELWQEPEITDEATPQWVTSDLQPEATIPAETISTDDWDTLAAVTPAVEESIVDFEADLTQDEPIRAQETVAADWDEDWGVAQPIEEPVTEMTADVWDVPAASETPVITMTEEAKIAQLALNLTQVSLEVSAEGTILTRDNQIIAAAGHLSQNDTLELASVINYDWGTGGQGARLRFITLPSSGKEYMLYSTGTEDDLILSMIFAGSTPLRVIRQQGQRLIKALGDVPEPEIKLAHPEAISIKREVQPIEEALEPYAYVWLVQNPEQPLNSAVAQSISAGLMTQLTEMNWQIEQLQVQDEYIYLLANVPGETPSYAVVRDLKQRAASIAQKQAADLDITNMWADSYLVLSPGRELAPDEIQEFIDFQRMM